MADLVLVIHNIRSIHNVGSLLRSADGFSVSRVYLTGYTPYPQLDNDQRLPHIRAKITQKMHKTALGAEETLDIVRVEAIGQCLDKLSAEGYQLAALEQTSQAVNLNRFRTSIKMALVVGNELTGLEPAVLDKMNSHIQIPMLGAKESFNVSVAAAIALYHLRWTK
jgi:tRNA G18 (ribose-2'-O)-methylase SpoU